MSEVNKSYRIRTDIGSKVNDGFVSIDTELVQDYETLDILSVKLNSSEMYRLHNSNYGVVVGRVLANNGFGVPNAKLSIFISSDGNDGEKVRSIYPFVSTNGKNDDGVRYNLLPDDKVNDCHQVVGTFPNKRFMLDNDIVLEVYDKYYKYTTRTNNSGDYLIMGVPVGTHTLHMDLDLSDCGILSQKPRDFVYKGYTVEQFENPTTFKGGTNYSELSQIFTQNQIVTVRPFWGNESLGEPIGITRADIDISFKFEPTCVFIGCVASDNASNGITQKCMGTENMGNMEELTTGSGTIEMIRKTPSGDIESFQIRGTQLINGDGVWCYQIPMNLDYMMTDEYGNMVPTDDPNKGIPTRTSVRFRISMQDNEENLNFYYRAKVLVPHNPQALRDGTVEEYDYEFGTYTKDESFRDLFWDNVYTVKSYIPRFQKKKVRGWKDKRFTGIKNCNFFGNNNPIPYNNIRIRLPFMFTIMCAILKCLIFLVSLFNSVVNFVGYFLAKLGGLKIWKWRPFGSAWDAARGMKLSILNEGLCPDLENWYFAPILGRKIKKHKQYNLLKQTLDHISKEDSNFDETSVDFNNSESEDEVMCLTTKTDYLISCMEMNLAMEYRVVNFDFYNDWINGLIYVPRFRRYIRPKKKFLGFTIAKAKVRGCMDNTKTFAKSRRYTQLCSISYIPEVINNKNVYTNADNPLRSSSSKRAIRKANKYHKKPGISQFKIFGKRGGVCHEHTTSKKQNVYYMKPCEVVEKNTYTGKVTLFATDIVLLGSLKSCDENGLPQAFKYLSSTSYIMPTNLALTNMESNGYLYTNDNNTVCAGKSNQLITDDTETDNGVSRANPDDGLAAELMMYRDSGDENIDAQYDGNELSDIIPLTEAAGISWNYTGPGQGGVNESVMYNPGGHFLGLSCINSQTNVKSCINLSRICEVGVNMSERKEDIGYLNGDGENEQPVYVYSAPTGFISGSDIIGDDFRTMFATLNHKRLQATKLNPETGYYYYDFDFVKPLNFNGEFKYMVNKGKSNYNNGSGTLIDNWDNGKNKNIFKLLGINIKTEERPDFDNDESLHTQTKTYEATSIDYYRFRFGLNDDDLINKRNSIHDSHFLTSRGNKKILPQYENSFYFYFGMKAGASAIDEFNKQFFATCETSVLKQLPPSINAKVEELDICRGTGVVKIVLDNIETPTVLFSCTTDKGDGIEKVKLVDVGVDEKKDKPLDNNKYVHEFELEFGTYHFDVMDANGELLSTDIAVGVNLFNYDIIVSEFNVNYATDLINEDSRRDDTKNLMYGGFVEVSNLTCDENYIDFINSAVTLSIDGVNMLNDECSGSIVFDGFLNDNKLEKGSTVLYVNSANTRYNLYLIYKCSIEKKPVEHKIFLQTFEVRDGSSVELRMGYSDVPFYLTVEPSSAHTPNTLVVPLSGFNDDTGKNFDKIIENSGNYLLFGSCDNYWGDGFEKDYFINSSGETEIIYSNWLKRISTIKSTLPIVPFSNNIHTSSGYKVVWGEPQNENNIKNGVIYSTEDFVDLYSGYNLDDDSSHHGTNGKYYSAIGIDDTNVSGDFFAYLSGGTITLINGNKNEYTNKYQNFPRINSGYVFKSIPSGELYFYVYSANTQDVSFLMKPESENAGVYYSSFIYPVIESPFKTDIRFYIWEGISLVRDENSDAEAEMSFTELAGRTEAKIENGIRFNGLLGSSNGKSGFSMSNVNIKQSEVTGSSIYLTGMNVTVVVQDENNETEKITVSAIATDDDCSYSLGVSGVSDVFYEISEGYPVVENSGFDFSQLVINTSNNFNYKDYFADYITYTIKSGIGLDIVPKGDNNIGSFILNDFGRYTTENGFICAHAKNKKGLIYTPKGNDKFIYIRLGGRKRPTYYVLCKYVESGSYNNKTFENKKGDLCILTIDYYKDRKYKIFWSFNAVDDSDNETETNLKTYVSKYKRAGSHRNNLNKLLGYNINNENNPWGDEKNNRNKSYLNWMEPVIQYRMRADVENGDWLHYIKEDKARYDELVSNNEEILRENEHVYYFVDSFKPLNSNSSNDNMELYKIYPILIESEETDDTILSHYILHSNFLGETTNKIPDVTFYTIEGNKVSEITYTNNIGDSISYFTVSYEIEPGKINEDDENDVITYRELVTNHLVLEFSDKKGVYYPLSGLSINSAFTKEINDYYNFCLSGSCYITAYDDSENEKSKGVLYLDDKIKIIQSGTSSMWDGSSEYLYTWVKKIKKTYLFQIKMESGNFDKSTNYLADSIYFHVGFICDSSEEESEPGQFYIERDAGIDYFPHLYQNEKELGLVKNSNIKDFEEFKDCQDYYLLVVNNKLEYNVEINCRVDSKLVNDFNYHSAITFDIKDDYYGYLTVKNDNYILDKKDDIAYVSYSANIKSNHGINSGWTKCVVANNYPGYGSSDIFKKNVLIYKEPTLESKHIYVNTEMLNIPYFYDSNKYSILIESNMYSNEELLTLYKNGNLKLFWKEDIINKDSESWALLWTLAYKVDNISSNEGLLVTFIKDGKYADSNLEDSDKTILCEMNQFDSYDDLISELEWSYYNNNNSLLTKNSLVLEFSKDEVKEHIEVLIERVPLVRLRFEESPNISYIRIEDEKENCIYDSEENITNGIPRLIDTQDNFILRSTRNESEACNYGTVEVISENSKGTYTLINNGDFKSEVTLPVYNFSGTSTNLYIQLMGEDKEILLHLNFKIPGLTNDNDVRRFRWRATYPNNPIYSDEFNTNAEVEFNICGTFNGGSSVYIELEKSDYDLNKYENYYLKFYNHDNEKLIAYQKNDNNFYFEITDYSLITEHGYSNVDVYFTNDISDINNQ